MTLERLKELYQEYKETGLFSSEFGECCKLTGLDLESGYDLEDYMKSLKSEAVQTSLNKCVKGLI